jgi:hypothetical protein
MPLDVTLDPEDNYEILMAAFDDVLDKSRAQITPEVDEAMLHLRDLLRIVLGCSN